MPAWWLVAPESTKAEAARRSRVSPRRSTVEITSVLSLVQSKPQASPGSRGGEPPPPVEGRSMPIRGEWSLWSRLWRPSTIVMNAVHVELSLSSSTMPSIFMHFLI